MVVAVEGMDGAGKTVIARHIAEKHGFEFMEKPLQYFYNDGPEGHYNDLLTVSSRLYELNDNVIKTWYFSLGNLYATRVFSDKNIVFDRHLVSNYYWNADEESAKVFDLLIPLGGVPDMTFLLYASPEVRMQRIHDRNPNDPDLTDPDMLDDGREKMLYFLNKYNMPYVFIDTDNKSLDEVKEIVDGEMERLKGQTRKLVK